MYPFVFYVCIIHIHQKEKSDPDPFSDRDPLVVIAAPWMQLIHVPRVNSLEFYHVRHDNINFQTY